MELYESDPTKEMRALDSLLIRVGLRSKDDSAETIFSKLVNVFSHWLRPKSASLKISMTDGGIPVVAPTLEFGDKELADAPKDLIQHEDALRILNKSLEEGEVTAWVVLDRLDEAFQGFPNIEVPALRALLRTYLDLSAYPRIRLKLFVRNDLFRKVIAGGFVNLTHVNARKVEIVWEEEDLLNLVCRRVRDSIDFVSAAQAVGLGDKAMFDRIFPAQVIRERANPPLGLG